jgi:hypothetical protein
MSDATISRRTALIGSTVAVRDDTARARLQSDARHEHVGIKLLMAAIAA